MGKSYHFPVRDTGHLSDVEVLAEAHERVEAFLELVRQERIGNDILDDFSLPASKASIENSFRLVIATEPRKQVRIRLAEAGLALARFLPDIGTRLSIDPAPPAAAGRPRRRSGQKSERLDIVFDAALAKTARETDRLRRIFAEAEAIAERRFEPLSMSPPFREDGTYTWYGHH